MTEIFVNYRTGDETYAAILLDEKLSDHFGRDRVFRDNRSIELGVDFRPVLWGGLAKSSVLIVVIGEHWLDTDSAGRRKIDAPGDFVRREIALALQTGLRVVPVLVGDVPLPRPDQLPTDIADLAHRQYLRLHTRGAQHDVARLIASIAEILSSTPVRSSTGLQQETEGARRATVAVLRIHEPDDPSTTGRVSRRAALRAAVDEAVVEARLADVEVGDRRAGVAIFVPPSTPPIRVAAAFVIAFDGALADQRPVDGPLRVKVAIGQGVVGGNSADVIDEAAHLLSHPMLDTVLQRAAGARIVLVVPDSFYSTVIRTDPRSVDLSRFLPTDVGDSDVRCWLHVPGYPAPPGVPIRRQPASTTAQSAQSMEHNNGVIFNNTGSDNHIEQYAGDRVHGEKHVHGNPRSRP